MRAIKWKECVMPLLLALAMALAGLTGFALAEEAASPVRKLIIDTDTGADDASALILAAKSRGGSSSWASRCWPAMWTLNRA